MTINKQALREAAEKALKARARLELIESIFDDDGDITTEAQEDIKICTSFNDLTNPATVLALLDELEAKDRHNAELNSTLERWAVDRAQSASELDDAEKRIAELEAREVVLPSVQDVHPLGPQSAKIFCEFHRNIINRCADEIRKVGVNVSIKGE